MSTPSTAPRAAGMSGLPDVASARPGGGRRLRWAVPVVVAAAVVALAWVAGPTAESVAGDPRSTGYGGLRGILDVAESLGRQVDISVRLPDDRTTTYLLPVDDLTPDERDAVRTWVGEGGRLVVADPGSVLTGVEAVGSLLTDVFGATRFDAACDLLMDVGLVRSTRWIALEIPPDAEACVRLEDEGAWLVRRSVGAGDIIALGGPGPLANEHLDDDDNALAGVAILAPTTDDRLLVRPLPGPGAGDEGLGSLVPRRVRHLLLAFVGLYGVVVWWRARRLGDPVDEPLPLRVPGAAIVDGVAGLLQRAGDRSGVARSLQRHLRTVVVDTLGVARDDLGDDEVAAIAEARLGIDATRLTAALRAVPAADEDLLTLGREIAALRALLRARRGGAASADGTVVAPTIARPDAPGDDA